MKKRLIINADDFGLCKGVNQAVAEAHQTGVLTSATLMANMPSAEEAVAMAGQLPSLGVGVHLNLTDGKPVSRESVTGLLTDSTGNFKYSTGRLSLLSLISPKFRQALRTELEAQIRWVIERGIRPTHLDSHKHIHSFPVIFSLVCRLAKKYGIQAVRFTYEPPKISALNTPPADREGLRRAAMIRKMAAINRTWQDRTLLKNEALYGIAHTGSINPVFFRAVVENNLLSTVEIMTHPGYPQA